MNHLDDQTLAELPEELQRPCVYEESDGLERSTQSSAEIS